MNWRGLGTRSIQSTQLAAISPGHPRRGGIAAPSEVEAVGRVVSCAQTSSGRARGVSRLAAWSTTVSVPAPWKAWAARHSCTDCARADGMRAFAARINGGSREAGSVILATPILRAYAAAIAQAPEEPLGPQVPLAPNNLALPDGEARAVLAEGLEEHPSRGHGLGVCGVEAPRELQGVLLEVEEARQLRLAQQVLE